MPDDADALEQSRRLVYLAAERTLTAWIRTALSLMALGFVIDRFGLILHSLPQSVVPSPLLARALSTWAGSILIGGGALLSLHASVRFVRFDRAYHRDASTRVGGGIAGGAAYGLLLAAFGAALIVLLVVVLS